MFILHFTFRFKISKFYLILWVGYGYAVQLDWPGDLVDTVDTAFMHILAGA